jgi:Fe-S cluster biogenesis protein NfuA
MSEEPFDSERLRARIEEELEKLRPYLQQDGGDVAFVDLTPERIVEVEFLGACGTCSLALMTLRAGIERALMLNIPGLKRIELAQRDTNPDRG